MNEFAPKMRNRIFVRIVKTVVAYIFIFTVLQILFYNSTKQDTSISPPWLLKKTKDANVEGDEDSISRNASDTTILVAVERTNNNQVTQTDNWLVLLTVNFGFIDMFYNWYWHFKRLQLNLPVVVMAEDNKTFDRLKFEYKDTTMIERSGSNSTDSAVNFGSASFKKLVSQRPTHILKYLQLGKNVLYCDADSVWLKNPFPYLTGEFDIWAQIDAHEFCTGFLAIKANDRTIQFTEDWKMYMSQRTNINDQEGFNAVNKSALRIHKLDTNYFPYGLLYFSRFDNFQRSKVVVVHNNWIVGHNNKVQRFKRFGLWQGDTHV